ncbi:MAG: hypothetical protein LAO05_02765 [Acidobacteriia bacterium]|nr:hypothetical protein [Terriglobia bacterium]
MSPWAARLAVSAVFIAGFLCGAVTVHLTHIRVQRHIMDSPDGMAGILVHRLDRDLNLTGAQRRQIEAAAARAHSETTRVMQPVMPQMNEIFERLRTEIRAVLTDDQRVRFDRMVNERRPFLNRMWARPPHPTGAEPTPVPTPGT